MHIPPFYNTIKAIISVTLTKIVKISYLKLIYSLRENFIHDQDNTNGTGTVAQTVPETTTVSKIRIGVYHYHFQIFF